jgi:nitroimidazol reductase NimA-like FMN-containing flavoprotein (pyridoxamine 5'-phosphate oxidase superfamily)
MNHGYDEREHCLYFHCAPTGKKVDLIRANPRVWGQVLEDGGYLDGECDHAYRTVQFQGRAEFVEDQAEKGRALALMIDQLESAPEPVKARNLLPEKIAGVCILRVRLGEMSGKAGPKPES